MRKGLLEGYLGAFSAEQVLQFVGSGSRQGTLSFAGQQREVRFVLENGAITGVISSDPRLQFSGGDGDVDAAVKRQVTEALIEVMSLPAGEFSFVDDAPELPHHARFPLEEILSVARERVAELRECLTLLPDPNATFRVVENPQTNDKITLTLEQWQFALKLDGTRTLEDLCRESNKSRLEVYRTVYALLESGLIEPVEAPAADQQPAEPRVEPPPPAAQTSGAPAAPQEPPRAAEVHDVPRAQGPTVAPAKRSKNPTVQNVKAPVMTTEPIRADLVEESLTRRPEGADINDSSVSNSRRYTMACLTLDEGSREAFPLIAQEHTIGRDAKNSIVIPDASVSSLHARIMRTPDGYMLADEKSRNGTWVNGQRITQKLLQDNDRVRLGKVQLIYSVAEEKKRVAAATMMQERES